MVLGPDQVSVTPPKAASVSLPIVFREQRHDVADTAPAIRQYADEHDADLSVMGTNGRSGLDRLVVGSVAEKVIRQSEVPVVTVRPTSGDT